MNHWDISDYGLYFFSGYLAWNLFANSSTLAAESIVGNATYVTRVYVPKAIFPLAAVAVNVIDFAVGFSIILMLAAILGRASVAMLFVPLAVVITVVFVAGASLLCASYNVMLRDFRHLLASVLFIWFFLSPILWKPSVMPSDVSTFIAWNPIAPFLRLFQSPIWASTVPTFHDVALASGISVVVFAVGLLQFIRSERDFYYYL